MRVCSDCDWKVNSERVAVVESAVAALGGLEVGVETGKGVA